VIFAEILAKAISGRGRKELIRWANSKNGGQEKRGGEGEREEEAGADKDQT
jgi:hypothetical protein